MQVELDAADQAVAQRPHRGGSMLHRDLIPARAPPNAREHDDLDIDKAVADASRRATRLLGATKPKSRRLAVILDPDVTASKTIFEACAKAEVPAVQKQL